MELNWQNEFWFDSIPLNSQLIFTFKLPMLSNELELNLYLVSTQF